MATATTSTNRNRAAAAPPLLTATLSSSVFLFVLLCSVIIAVAAAEDIPTYTPAPCQVPTIPSSFFVVEGLTMDGNQNQYNLYLSPNVAMPAVVANDSIAVKASCIDRSKSLDLYIGTEYISIYSSYVGGTGFPAIKFSSTCVDAVLFNIFHNDDFTYTITNSSGTCLATALDTTLSDVVLTQCSNRTNVLASAHKTYKDLAIQTPDGSFPAMAYWTVATTTMPSSQLDPSVILFLMSIKDNDVMDCSAGPTTPSPSTLAPSSGGGGGGGLSSAATIVIAVLLSMFGAVGVYLLLRKYFRRSDYAEMRVAMNENHEA